MHNYHATHGVFPEGMSMNTAGTGANVFNAWTGWSAQALMLGQLDQLALYNAANFNITPTGYAPFNVQNGDGRERHRQYLPLPQRSVRRSQRQQQLLRVGGHEHRPRREFDGRKAELGTLRVVFRLRAA